MTDDLNPELFAYEGRVASFQKSKKRGSAANGRGKALNWPHKSISPEDLAKAGFYFSPSPDNPDNVVCFICRKNMDGWEAGDDPLLEHLDHSAECGWAILSAVEADVRDFATRDPSAPEMMEARKVTFGGRWPHEGKRAWKCKTKQLVEAGWKYTPSLDADDMATCTYCQLSLDGWEQNDKPWDEHFTRVPNCPFFQLYEQFGPPKKKSAARSKASAAKNSRLSVQSTAPSETTMADLTVTTVTGMDDTMLTTASTATQGTKKGRARKGTTTSKAKKTKTKKEDVTETGLEEVQTEAQTEPPAALAPEPTPEPTAEAEPEPEPAPVPVPKAKAKPKRGKKRGSEALEESATVTTEAAVSKRRDTRTREESVDTFMTAHEDTDMTIEPEPKQKVSRSRKASATRTASTSRKVSALSRASTLSIASTVVPIEEFPDDDEIERQLQADLDQLSDGEVHLDSDSERRRSKSRKPTDNHAPQNAHNSHYAMFDPTPKETDDAALENELDVLQAEMEVDEPQEQQLVIPKKGRKATARKASKQSQSKKTKTHSPPAAEEEVIPVPEPASEPVLGTHDEEVAEEEEEASIGSTDTVIKKTEVESDSEPEQPDQKISRLSKVSFSSPESKEVPEPVQAAKKTTKRGRPSKMSTVLQEARVTEEMTDAAKPVKRGRGRPSKASAGSQVVPELAKQGNSVQPEPQEQQPVKRNRGRPPKDSMVQQSSLDADTTKTDEGQAKRKRGRPPKNSVDSEKPKERLEFKMPGAFREDTVEPREEVEEDTIPGEVKEFEADEDSVVDSDELAGEFPMPPPNKVPTRQMKAPTPALPSQISSPATGRQAVMSPSQSPQSSDAENQPPSSLPASSAVKRIPLAPRAVTPVQNSPSKRKQVAGLQSSVPWTPVDLDAIFGTPQNLADKENGLEKLLRKGKELTSPEKRMTVEEWIQFNAGQAGKALKHECETMVSKFESEGTRAMRVLEGLEVDE